MLPTMPKSWLIAVSSFFAILANTVLASEGYYRDPSLAGSTLIFSAEGDIWRAELNNDSNDADPVDAHRLTTHASLESQAIISPDSQTVAYVANYTGVNEIYVVPQKGGLPSRVSFEHAAIRLQHWIDDNHLLYSTNSRPGAPSNWTLKIVNVRTLAVENLPVADALSGYVDQVGKNRTLFFVQFGIQMATDNTNYYRGGMRGRLWRFDLDSKDKDREALPLLEDHEGNIRDPMVYRERLYFISDASGRDNIWSADLDGMDVRQLTTFEEWSVREARLAEQTGKAQIVFRKGADLHMLPLDSSGQAKPLSNSLPIPLPISLHSDHPEMRDKWIKKPLKYLTHIQHTNNAKKVVLTARGKMALVGLDQSRLVTVNTPTTSRNRNGILSLDGESVFALNDQTGENEVWQFSAMGSRNATQLTNDGKGFKQNLQLSPNGNWLSYEDGLGGLWLLEIDTKKTERVIENSDGFEPFGRLAWSPDGQYFAVAHTPYGEQRSRILLHSISENRQEYVTTAKYSSRAPQFSADGAWLFYLSERQFTPTPSHPWLDRDFGTAFQRRSIVLANALTDDAAFPFSPATELSSPKEEEQDDQNTEPDESDEEENIDIAWQGIADRLYQVPVPPNSYSKIELSKERLFLEVAPERPNEKTVIETSEIKADPKLKTFAKDMQIVSLSEDGKDLVVLKQDNSGGNHKIYLVPAKEKMPKELADHTFKSSNWQFQLSPKEEWQQIFDDAWLMHRELFFDRNLRGVDWVAMKQKYQPLVDRVTSRDELSDVFRQMMGELNALHSQVRNGDVPEDSNTTPPGMLGAILKTYRKAKGVEINRIYLYDKELPATAPPLAHPETDARAGDIIIGVNGVEISTITDLYLALQNQVGKQVLLDLKRKTETLQTIVRPVDHRADAQLRYQDWVERNRIEVGRQNAELGYLHLQSMVGRDVGSFATEFHANNQKKGIIIDVRRNNGGNVDSWLISHLMREAWAFWKQPLGEPYVNMQRAFRGHLVVLADERTYSDGETFTAAVKHFGIADVIGRTTAGAGVWLSNNNRHSDGGIARAAQSPVFNLGGEWVVEGHGISPTIEVVNYPHETFNGKDAQLEAAIRYLEEKIQNEPIAPLEAQPFPRDLQPAKDVQPR